MEYKKANYVIYYVDYTHGNSSRIIAKSKDFETAKSKGEKFYNRLIAKGKTDFIITLYNKDISRGLPMQKILESWQA